MVSTSKILTVSYGTFSCTLEGFDDPFSTMRSISEYFRDLAADDRYFGAEPPTPDAEMLHRIAEREIKRKVDARVVDDSIILRQMDRPLPEGKASIVPGEALLQEPTPTETAVSALTHKAHSAPAPSPKPQEKPVTKVEEAPAELSDSSIAAKLQRIRAVVGNGQSQAGVDQGNNLENGLGDDFFAGSEAPEVESHLDSLETDASIESSVPETAPASKKPEVKVETPSFDEKTPEETIAAVEAVIPDDSPKAEDVFDVADDDFEEGVIEAKSLSDPSDVSSSEDALEASVESDVDDDFDASILSGISAALLSDDVAVEAPKVEIEDDLEDDEAYFEDENDFAEAPAPKPIAIARVVKVRRTDRGASTQRPSNEIAEPIAVAPKAKASDFSSDESTLPDDEEASLLAELAQVESQATREAEIVNAGQKVAETESALTAFDDGDFAGTDALDRIMAETNTKIDSDEATRKRTSIAHLRAAVQAKRADAQAGDLSLEEDTSEEYREDLARVVRPRRPRAEGKSAGRRLAPLVLVSEQRVDEIAPASSSEDAPDGQSVRPRRVRKVRPGDIKPVINDQPAEAADPEAESKEAFAERFAAFANQNRAEGISEWFEAAAAFRTFISGQETFSRPQLMGLVLKTSPEKDLTRELALGAFGQLIREGTIKKIQRGRYTISENTRFRPGQERARA